MLWSKFKFFLRKSLNSFLETVWKAQIPQLFSNSSRSLSRFNNKYFFFDHFLTERIKGGYYVNWPLCIVAKWSISKFAHSARLPPPVNKAPANCNVNYAMSIVFWHYFILCSRLKFATSYSYLNTVLSWIRSLGWIFKQMARKVLPFPMVFMTVIITIIIIIVVVVVWRGLNPPMIFSFSDMAMAKHGWKDGGAGIGWPRHWDAMNGLLLHSLKSAVSKMVESRRGSMGGCAKARQMGRTCSQLVMGMGESRVMCR